MNSQRLWQHAQGLHRFGTDGVPDMKEEVDTCPSPKPEAIFVSNYSKMKIYNHASLGTTLKARPHSQQ